jgi:hypothetical protein
VAVSNAGYGLFGAAGELSDAQVSHILGSQARQNTVAVLKNRIAGFEAQAAVAASTDFRPASSRSRSFIGAGGPGRSRERQPAR